MNLIIENLEIITTNILTDFLDPSWHLFGTEPTINVLDISISTCSVTTIELGFAEIHMCSC